MAKPEKGVDRKLNVSLLSRERISEGPALQREAVKDDEKGERATDRRRSHQLSLAAPILTDSLKRVDL